MKKIIIYSISIGVLFAGMWACSDSFLEEEPKGFLSESNLANADGVNAALIGAYALLDGMNDENVNTWTANPHNWIFGSITTDDAYKGSEQTDFPEFTQLEIYQWSSGNSVMNDKWVMSYEGIVRANSAIKLLGLADEEVPDRNRLEAEAKFLRAHYHFELYKVWGNIPYFTEEDETYIKSNENVDPLGDAIADLEDAISELPPSQSDMGRIAQVGARAYLGKMYMYRYGDTGEASDLNAAKTQLDLVVDPAALAPCFKDVFQSETEGTNGHLFSVIAAINDGSNSRNANWLNQLAFPAGPEFGCCGFHQPSQNLVNAYKVDVNGLPLLDNFNDSDLEEEGLATQRVDPRLDLTVGRDNVPFLDWAIHTPEWIRDRAFSGLYSPKKFIHYKAEPVSGGGWNNNANNGLDFPIIRMADVMLLLAEAEVELGNLGRAEELVNHIRERAGNCAQGDLQEAGGSTVITNDIDDGDITWADYEVAEYPVGTFNTQGQDFARKAVRFERRLELALEGHRLFDLRRWGNGAEVLNTFVAHAAETRSYYDNAETYDNTRHRWFPIPIAQITANTRAGEQILKQNSPWAGN